MEGGPALYLAVGLGVLLSAATWAMVGLRLLLRQRFDLLDVFVLSFGAVYGVGFAFVIHATQSGRNPAGGRILGLEQSYWIIPALAFVCVVACMACGSLLQGRVPPAAEPADGGNRHPLDETRWRVPLAILAWLFLGIAFITSTLYTRAYGGFAGFFAVAGALRAGLFEEAGANPLSFLKPFGGFCIFATYLFAASWASGPGGRSLWSAIGLLASFLLSSVTLLGWGGRVDLLVFWTTVVFGGFIYRVGVSPRLLAGASALVACAILVMPPLTDAMNPGKSRASYAEFFAAELSFPVESSLNALEIPGYHYGADILAAPLFILPERLWSGLQVRPISDVNSEALLGDVPREGFGYTIPADFITFGLYQFGIPGPLVVAILWCLFLIRLDAWIIERVPRSISAFLYAHAFFSIAALSTLYVDPKMQIARNFHFIAGLVSLLFMPWLVSSTSRGRSAMADDAVTTLPRCAASSYRDPIARG